jgi:hypothetical protein
MKEKGGYEEALLPKLLLLDPLLNQSPLYKYLVERYVTIRISIAGHPQRHTFG